MQAQALHRYLASAPAFAFPDTFMAEVRYMSPQNEHLAVANATSLLAASPAATMLSCCGPSGGPELASGFGCPAGTSGCGVAAVAACSGFPEMASCSGVPEMASLGGPDACFSSTLCSGFPEHCMGTVSMVMASSMRVS